MKVLYFMLAAWLFAPYAMAQKDEGHEPVIEVYNQKNNKAYRIDKAKKIKVYFRNSEGKFVAKKGTLVDANEYTVTFRPLNDKLKDITYCYNCQEGSAALPMRYIAFFTTKSIVRGILVPAALVGGFVLIATSPGGQAVLFGSVLIAAPIIEFIASGDGGSGKHPGSFRKHVNFSPVSLWRIRLVQP